VAFTYANVMAYNADKIGEPPHSWADFWNVEKWPGRRGFWFTPKGTIEAALMADGVAPADIYKVLREPDGIDRAFRKLDELKPHILFWKTGAESVNRLASGEYAMTLAWTGRIDVANREDKQNFKIAWDSGFTYGQDLWAVVAGSPNKDLAIEAIRSTINPERQAEFMKLIAASAPVGKAYELLDPARLDALPLAGDHAATGVKMDEEFWRENNEALTERFAAWAAQ
jgi:putative spermidine/putrescine transport system substrate-binding protein